jgi:hypothetical protein
MSDISCGHQVTDVWRIERPPEHPEALHLARNHVHLAGHRVHRPIPRVDVAVTHVTTSGGMDGALHTVSKLPGCNSTSSSSLEHVYQGMSQATPVLEGLS